jgi:hypothetical protein
LLYEEEIQSLQMYRVPTIPFDELTDVLGLRMQPNGYPHGFNNDQEFLSSAILSATNRQVDQWNSIVQELNQTSELMELNPKDLSVKLMIPMDI